MCLIEVVLITPPPPEGLTRHLVKSPEIYALFIKP
jgi:hypothetical protein